MDNTRSQLNRSGGRQQPGHGCGAGSPPDATGGGTLGDDGCGVTGADVEAPGEGSVEGTDEGSVVGSVAGAVPVEDAVRVAATDGPEGPSEHAVTAAVARVLAAIRAIRRIRRSWPDIRSPRGCGAVRSWVVRHRAPDRSTGRRDFAVWGLGFAVVAVATFWLSHGHGESVLRLLVTALTTIWGLRLSVHIHARNVRQREDRRYAAIALLARARRSPKRYLLVRVYLAQAAIMWFVSLPVQVAQYSTGGPVLRAIVNTCG